MQSRTGPKRYGQRLPFRERANPHRLVDPPPFVSYRITRYRYSWSTRAHGGRVKRRTHRGASEPDPPLRNERSRWRARRTGSYA